MTPADNKKQFNSPHVHKISHKREREQKALLLPRGRQQNITMKYKTVMRFKIRKYKKKSMSKNESFCLFSRWIVAVNSQLLSRGKHNWYCLKIS